MARDKIVITGISGNLGRALAKQLHKTERIVGIDRRPFFGKPKDLDVFQLDIRRKKTEEIFRRRDVKAVIHMGIIHDPRLSAEEHHSFNVGGTTNILEYCARYQVPKLVVLSSASVYGPSPNNTNFLTEDAPLMAGSRFPDIRDLIEVDMYAQQFIWRHPQVETVILRPVHIVGPTIKNAPSNYLRLKYPWVLAGFDPMVQLIYVDDVCRAMQIALKPGLRGIYNVGGSGEVPLSAVFRELGAMPLPVPHFLARPLLGSLFRAHLASFPEAELDHIQFLCTVDASRFAADANWQPAFTLRETIRSVLGETPRRRDAA
jgi:UDP-glucose 4-epimerase